LRDFLCAAIRQIAVEKHGKLNGKARFVIAMHSPAGTVETGRRVCPPEKKAGKLP
jgi:hypothetical protein